MDLARLAYMADQIARNFAVQGENEAVAATAEHIRLYWDPRMKAQFLASDRAALTPIVAAVAERMAEQSTALETSMSKAP